MDISKLIGLDKLDGILSRIEKRPLTVFVGQCLKERDRTLSCDACQRACPAAAIDLSSGVDIAFDRCVDCGICVNICPAGAIESRLTEDFFLSRIQNVLQSGPLVGFSCEKQITAAGAKSPVEVQVPCVGRVSETMLIGAAVFGAEEVWLNTSLCPDCDCRQGLALAGQTVRGVDKLLEAWGRAVRFSLTAKAPTVETSGVAEDQGEEYNRRELLVKLKREALVAGLGLAQGKIDQAAEAFEPAAAEGLLDYRLPRKRELLLQLIRKLGQPGQAALSIEDLSFCGLAIKSDRCNLCGNCALFCPTKSLRTETGDDAARLWFNVSRCLGCDLCIQVCRPQALAIDSRVFPADIYNQDTRLLVELSYHRCEKCQQLFAAAQEKALCDFCQLREDKLKDDAWSQ